MPEKGHYLPDHGGKGRFKNDDLPLLEEAPPHVEVGIGKIVHD
jgi:hypothetical protein